MMARKYLAYFQAYTNTYADINASGDSTIRRCPSRM
jgi:radical SAM superfamily enzyme